MMVIKEIKLNQETNMKEILFPTAYSSHSKVAYRNAQKLAQYFGASITLVHVYESPGPLMTGSIALENELASKSLQSFADRQWAEQMDKLKDFAEEMNAKQFQDISLDFIVTDGIVLDELLEINRKNHFDLVVMGMRRHNLISRLFGNTTYGLIDKMDCPVLLIPPDAHYMGVDRIVYGTAFEFGDIKAIDHLMDWCQAFDANLHVLHVYSKEDKQEASQKMTKMINHYQEEQDKGVIEFKLSEGKIAEALEQYIDFSKADILAIHRRKQGFWQRINEGSLTKQLAEEVKVPLLVLKS